MVTKETKFPIRYTDWEAAFTVHDNKNWTVSLSNRILEVGATSEYCQQNWDKGLAEVFTMVADMVDIFEALDLLDCLDKEEHIDSKFVDFLPQEWQRCVERRLDKAYDIWETTWIDGPQS